MCFSAQFSEFQLSNQYCERLLKTNQSTVKFGMQVSGQVCVWRSLVRTGLLQSRWVETRGGWEEGKIKAGVY